MDKVKDTVQWSLLAKGGDTHTSSQHNTSVHIIKSRIAVVVSGWGCFCKIS